MYAHTELAESRSENDQLHLTLKSQPRVIDPQRCTNCGLCLEECPAPGAIITAASAENHPRFAVHPAACLFFQDGSCRRCQEICPTQAIDLSRPETVSDLEAAASSSPPAINPRRLPPGGIIPIIIYPTSSPAGSWRK